MNIIIGQGAAGTTAANTLKQLGKRVTVITNETDWYYSRIDLPDIVSGKYSPEDATLQAAEAFDAQGIQCLMGETVTTLDPGAKTVEMASGKKLTYDKLLLATGSTPVVPAIEGSLAAGIYCLWTMPQARAVMEAAAKAKSAVVVGAGLIGLKTALALKKRGLKVTVIEKMPRILPQQLDAQGASIIRVRVEAAGVKILTGVQVEAFTSTYGVVSGVALDSGEDIGCELAVVAVGVRANTALAKGAGLEVCRGIVTDEFLTTSDPNIFAAGDAAEVFDSLSGRRVLSATWPAAIEQGAVAARNMAESKTGYEGYLAMNSVDIAGVPIISAGDILGDEKDEVFSNCKGEIYKRLVVRDNVLRGALFIGEVRQAGVLVNNIIRQTKMENTSPLVKPFNFIDLLAI